MFLLFLPLQPVVRPTMRMGNRQHVRLVVEGLINYDLGETREENTADLALGVNRLDARKTTWAGGNGVKCGFNTVDENGGNIWIVNQVALCSF